MANTSPRDLRPENMLDLANLFDKGRTELENIFNAYGVELKPLTKDEFITFVQDYKGWRELMIKSLQTIREYIVQELQDKQLPKDERDLLLHILDVYVNDILKALEQHRLKFIKTNLQQLGGELDDYDTRRATKMPSQGERNGPQQ